MCGLVGYMSKVSNSPPTTSKVFKQMLFADALRGEDSTGVFYSARNGRSGYYKEAVPSYDFLADKRVDKLLNDRQLAFMVGHNRYATSGSSWDVAGAHPFRHGKITMVHNGTLDDHHDLPDGKDFVVDSEAVCHNLDKHGYKKTIKKLEGAFALIWYNSEDKKLCFVRNTERNLFIAETPSAIFFASEEGLLRWVLGRNSVNITSLEKLPVGELRQYDITAPALTLTTTEMELAPYNFTSKYDYSSYYLPNKPTQGGSSPTGNTFPLGHSSDVSCCICADVVPSTLAARVSCGDEWVCKDCDELYYQADGNPSVVNDDWLPSIER